MQADPPMLTLASDAHEISAQLLWKKVVGSESLLRKTDRLFPGTLPGRPARQPRQVPIEVLPYAPPYSGTIFLI